MTEQKQWYLGLREEKFREKEENSAHSFTEGSEIDYPIIDNLGNRQPSVAEESTKMNIENEKEIARLEIVAKTYSDMSLRAQEQILEQEKMIELLKKQIEILRETKIGH